MKNFFMNPKFIVTAAIFVAAFVLVTLLFVKKPNVIKECKNPYIKAVAVFCLAFVPGVFMATVCAKAITALYGRFFRKSKNEISLNSNKEEKISA
ncbi:MAG: hypothetical protein K5979_04110 [Ruminococcus sp.]|nr:hypothetical protein [Ruminococcus sp.]